MPLPDRKYTKILRKSINQCYNSACCPDHLLQNVYQISLLNLHSFAALAELLTELESLFNTTADQMEKKYIGMEKSHFLC